MRKFPDAKGHKWVAESAVEKFGNYAGLLVYSGRRYEPTSKQEQIDFAAQDPKRVSMFAALYCVGTKLIQDARSALAKYIETGDVTDELFRAAFGLVGLDVYFRSGYVTGIGDKPDVGDMDDLRRLWHTLESSDMCNLEVPLILNPTFGAGSILVGGADADVISDDTLIDIKTTKFAKITQDYYHQLVGYWALSLIGGVGGVAGHKIGRLGVYFSRYGVLYTMPLPKIDDIDGFLDNLTSLACRHKLSPISDGVGWRQYVEWYDRYSATRGDFGVLG